MLGFLEYLRARMSSRKFGDDAALPVRRVVGSEKPERPGPSRPDLFV
jgi:hypothetical protein